MKTALITGITGQDGSYLTELLLSKGYEVHGLVRKGSSSNSCRLDHLHADHPNAQSKIYLHTGDLSDSGIITDLIWKIQPTEVYNLGAQSHVKVSFEMPEFTGNITALASIRMLDAIRRSGVASRFYQASSSEMFGGAPSPQNEQSPFSPRSPYAAAKVYAYWITVNYRESYNLFAVSGILFNHESPRRGDTFVTRKITKAVTQIVSGKQDKLYLGNVDSKRDWGFAPEYVEVMWMMLQQEKPSDYVIGTGESHTVKEFVEKAFSYAGVELEWVGKDVAQKGIVKSVEEKYRPFLAPGKVIIEIDPNYFRPTEVDHLKADITKIKTQLGWQPRVTFDDLVKIMTDYDLSASRLQSPGEGAEILKRKGFLYTNNAPFKPSGF